MSRIRADRIVNRTAIGAPLFPNGAVITGVATATTFKGALEGNVTGNTSGTAGGLSGTPDITVRNIVGTAATFSGVLTYEDVTNVDSVGLITARTGVKVLDGGVNIVGGGITSAGIATFHNGADFDGGAPLREKINIVANKVSAVPNIDLSNGMVHYFTTAESAQSIPNVISSVGINTEMAIGDTISVNIITTAAAAGYATTIKIDGSLIGSAAVRWVGGSAPSAGGSSGLDIYSYQIIKTANSTFTVIGNLTNAA